MSHLSKVSAGRFELAICILGPIVALAAIVIPGHIYCGHLRQELATKAALLDTLPELEGLVGEARKVLQPFEAAETNVDKASDLTLAVNQAAQDQGFVSRSVNVEKQSGAGVENCADYQIAVNGDGSLRSVVGILDVLAEPARNFRVARVALHAKEWVPETLYDSELTFVVRTVAAPAGSATPPPGVSQARLVESGARIKTAMGSVKSWPGNVYEPLVLTRLENRKRTQAAGVPVVVPEAGLLLKLNGIVRDRQHPLALTDRGLLGVGDEVDGFKVVTIADDHIELTDARGRRETVNLYGD